MTGHLALASSAEMADIDARTIASGTGESVLIDRAGCAVWPVAYKHLGATSQTVVLFLCGKGNNGADGIAAARFAKQDGLDPLVFLLCKEEDAREQVQDQLLKAQESGITIHSVTDTCDQKIVRALSNADLIFDAMLGTGLRSVPRSPVAD